MARTLPFDYAVRNLGRSPARLIATVGGSALVVMLVLTAAAFVEGMRGTLIQSTPSHNVLLLSTGSEESLERSEISASVPSQVRASIPGIREELGVPFISPEINVAIVMHTGDQPERDLRGVIRGITPQAFLVHPQVTITDGRSPRQGHNELMVGGLAAEMLGLSEEELALGSTLWIDEYPWEIVGRFTAPNTVMDAELWAPLSDIQVAMKRDGISSVVITLDEAEFADVDVWAKSRLDLELVAMTQDDYYATLQRFYAPIQGMVWATAVLMGLAGLLGGLNTLYAAFISRTCEIGMLQSLGYRRRAILLSLVQESVLASSAGALLACAIGWVMLEGVAIRFSMGVFQLSVTPVVLFSGLGVGLLVGLIGAIPPALQCLRLPIPAALKAT